MQNLILDLKPTRHSDNESIYEFTEAQLTEYTKKIAEVCISLCQKNSVSGKGTNSCQYDIESIREHFNIRK